MAMRMFFDKLEEIPMGCREKARVDEHDRFIVDSRDLTATDLRDLFASDAHLRSITKSPRSHDRFVISREEAKDHQKYLSMSRLAATHGAELQIAKDGEESNVEVVRPVFRITEKEAREDFQKYLRLSEKAAEAGEAVEIVRE